MGMPPLQQNIPSPSDDDDDNFNQTTGPSSNSPNQSDFSLGSSKQSSTSQTSGKTQDKEDQTQQQGDGSFTIAQFFQGQSSQQTNVNIDLANATNMGAGAAAIQGMQQANMNSLVDAISNNVQNLAIGPTGAIATLGTNNDLPSCFQGSTMELDKTNGILSFGNMTSSDAQTAADMMSQNPDQAAKAQLAEVLYNNNITQVQFGNNPPVSVATLLGVPQGNVQAEAGGQSSYQQGPGGGGDQGGGGQRGQGGGGEGSAGGSQ